jgi:pimeloyl-ACP methyl ester carboxylesterase
MPKTAIVAALCLAACGSPRREAPPGTGPRLALTPCHIDWHSSARSDEVRCGVVDVFEDQGSRTGRTIPLRVALVPALAGRAEPDPIFVLAGGPGQAATQHIPELVELLSREHRKRDLVFVDQRGTGASHPFDCPEVEDGGFESHFRDTLDTPELRACLARFEKDGSRPERYTTAAAADDLELVRAALGSDKIDLWGVSYGTRLGFAYLRRHGEHVRSAVFDAVTPPTQSLLISAAEDTDRAFKLIFQACAADAACNAAFPKLESRFGALLADLARTPVRVRLTEPTSGAPVEVTLTHDALALGLRNLLYDPTLSSILPLLIDRACKGDFQPFVTEAVAFDLAGDLSQGLYLSVICGEDALGATPAEVARRSAGTLLGDSFAAATLKVCSYWPHGQRDAEASAPVRSDIPVLLLSGELDPVTPPSHAAEALRDLPHGVHVVVPGAGHGVSGRGCVPRLMSRFIDSAGAKALDTACVGQQKRPPFFLSFAGPKP